jgi:hypothetical protein
MVAILQHLVAIKLGGINRNNNLNRLPLVLVMTIIVNSSNLNSSLPLELLHLPMLLAIIMASLLHMLHKVMAILPILSRVDSKHMDMTVTLVIRTKGSSRATLSRLVMISRATAHLLMDPLETPLKMDLHPAMVVLVGPASHLQGSKLQHQLLGVTLAIPANLQPVLRQATRGKGPLHNLAMVLHRNLAMAPNRHSKVVMVRALMGSLHRRARSLLHLHPMGRLLLDLLRLVMGSMVTLASQDMVHPHHTLVRPLPVIRAMDSSSLMAMLMAVEAMGSLQHTLLKQHRIHLPPLPPPQQPQQLLLLLPTVGVPKLLQKVKLSQSFGVRSGAYYCACSLGKRVPYLRVILFFFILICIVMPSFFSVFIYFAIFIPGTP